MSAVLCRNITTLSCFDQPDQLMADAAFATVKLQVTPPPGENFEFANWGSYRTFSDDQSSVSRLSAKSLELCTENLGSETGSDVAIDCTGIFASSAASTDSSDRESSCTDDDRERSRSTAYITKPRNDAEAMKPASRGFPPPLTTMSGSNSLQVRRHREGGRLIIEAVETPFRSSYLQAERSGGRLRLCYLTDSDDSGPESPPPEAAEEEELEEPGNEIELGMEELEEEMNVERFKRWSRCKERRHEDQGLCNNWKPAFWVATS